MVHPALDRLKEPGVPTHIIDLVKSSYGFGREETKDFPQRRSLFSGTSGPRPAITMANTTRGAFSNWSRPLGLETWNLFRPRRDPTEPFPYADPSDKPAPNLDIRPPPRGQPLSCNTRCSNVHQRKGTKNETPPTRPGHRNGRPRVILRGTAGIALRGASDGILPEATT